MGRQLDEVGAVVHRFDVDARGQNAILPDVVHAFVNAANRLHRIAAVAHEHDALHDVGLVVLADDAQARRRAHADAGHVAHAHRHALGRADGNITNVLNGSDKANPAHVEGLLAERDALAADVLVGVGNRRL